MNIFCLFLTLIVCANADNGDDIYSDDGPAIMNQSEEDDLEIDRRIIGGRIARKNEFPYQVAIRFRDATLPICGGSIIDNNWVLTAAHCCNTSSMQLEVVPGSHTDLAKPLTQPFAVNVSKIWVHPNYNNNTKANDIAMLKVDGSLIQNRDGMYSEKIEMAKGPETFVGETATVSGYGRYSFLMDDTSKTLRTVDLEVLSNDKCQIYNMMFDDKSKICAGLREAKVAQNSCHGDSGGPLVVKQEDGKPLLVGVVSFGGGCCRPTLPSVYARVSFYEPLVREVIDKN